MTYTRPINTQNHSYIINTATAKRKKHHRQKRSGVPSKFIFAALIVFSVLLFLNLTVKITAASPENIEPRSKYYTCIDIEQGDTMWDIASEYITDEYEDYNEYISEIMSINKLSTENIRSGGKLCVPYYADAPIY